MHSFTKWFHRRKARAELDPTDQAQKAEQSEAKIRSLEEELEKIRGERTQQAPADDAVRSQLADLTNLAVDQRNEFAREKALTDERWAEEESRRKQNDVRLQELYDMMAKILEDRELDRLGAEEERLANEHRPGIAQVLEDLAKLSEEQRAVAEHLFAGWRVDSYRQHEEIIETIRRAAQDRPLFNVQDYLDEFTKALATEVRTLIAEVSHLRSQSSKIQLELAQMLDLKYKYAPGGLFDPDWKPPGDSSNERSSVTTPSSPPKEPISVKPAWRTVTLESLRKQRSDSDALLVRRPSPARSATWESWQTDLRFPIPPSPPADPSRRTTSGRVSHPAVATSWTDWQPDQSFAPSTPSLVESTPPQVDSPVANSWATWQPDPNFAPTPSPVERESPGLWGPRSTLW